VLLVAGEASGDLHAADLIAAMRDLRPDLEIVGIGGSNARSRGMETWIDIADIATFGLTEVFEKTGVLVRAYRRLRREIREGRPDLLVLIDFPEFNLALARIAKRAGVPVFYYVSPQVWAWRRGRIRKILRRIDRLAVLFPFEPAVYGGAPQVVFVGHPLLDRVQATAGRTETITRHHLAADRPLVVLLPGSRPREIERILPAMAGAARLLAARRSVQFALALAPTVDQKLVERFLAPAGEVAIPVIEEDTYNLIAASDLVLATSGTVTLETALLERPMVVMYRSSPMTFWTARMLVDVPAIAMPNLIAGRHIVPELLQRDVTPEKIASEAEAILADPERARRMSADLRAVRNALGAKGAAGRAARLAIECMR